jgi:hypothetical protein
MSNGKTITFGVLAAIIAAKAKFKGSRDVDIANFTGIPLNNWDEIVVKPFYDAKVMDTLTRNLFINSAEDFYVQEMVFIAENLGQLKNPAMCPISFYATQIDEPGVELITTDEVSIKDWLVNHLEQILSLESIQHIDPSFLFMIRLNDPIKTLSLDTSQLIANTIGPQLYWDVYGNLVSTS